MSDMLNEFPMSAFASKEMRSQAMADEITRLRAEVVSWSETVNRLERAAAQAAEDRANLRAEVERLRAALKPFAKAGELFGPPDPEGFDMLVYGPAAGKEFHIVGNDLRRAREAMGEGEKG